MDTLEKHQFIYLLTKQRELAKKNFDALQEGYYLIEVVLKGATMPDLPYRKDQYSDIDENQVEKEIRMVNEEGLKEILEHYIFLGINFRENTLIIPVVKKDQ